MEDKLLKDLMHCIEKSDNKHNDANLENVIVPACRKEKIASITISAAEPVVEKLLTIPTNAVLEGILLPTISFFLAIYFNNDNFSDNLIRLIFAFEVNSIAIY